MILTTILSFDTVSDTVTSPFTFTGLQARKHQVGTKRGCRYFGLPSNSLGPHQADLKAKPKIFEAKRETIGQT
jgi:hypothetical protein